ncbi:MAG TPA: ComF family protein [Pyrinomonadaceae bacterium]|nr:ComF family protein [Pyrinomonadaceae bacterium]
MSNVTASVISGAYDSVLALVYPQRCSACDRSVDSRHDGVACSSCWDATRIFGEGDTLCWKCGALSTATVAEEKRQTVRCGRCDADSFTGARACGLYEGALRASILALKREPTVARRLLQTLRQTQQRAPLAEVDLIVPVPLHASRERERGFNQAVVLARELARATKLPIDEYSLVRRVYTERHRAGMDARARLDSVEGAFEIRRAEPIAGRRVLLIDDVFTTGATVSECAAVLKSAGGTDVYVLTIARA